MAISNDIGAVVIGRNEGQRLLTCLDSISKHIDHIVYVDSGSIDNSIEEAKARNINVIILDTTIPFTAARARNAGAQNLLKTNPQLKFLQFIDGDCELKPQWLSTAYAYLQQNQEYAVACGRRRERFAEKTIYNRLCDIEWDTPVGEALACGGDALMRIGAFTQVDGFRNELIAGEEPELCFRLRQEGWKIRRLDCEMTLHDADMNKASQWWKRTKRSGYAFALGASIHGKSPERYWVKEASGIILWGICIPVSVTASGLFSLHLLYLFLIYPAQIIRVALKRPDLGNYKFYWSSSIVLGKFPEALGLLKFWLDRMTGKTSGIIEYK